jgi:hypothetical protein
MTEPNVIDAEVVDEQPTVSQAVVHHHHDITPVDLFPGATPAEVITQATAVADALKPILASQGMTTRIGPKDHVQVEGWQTLGALLKVTPVCVSTRRIEPKVAFTVKGKKKKWGNVDGRRQIVEEFDYSYEVEGYSWEATVEARTLDGRTIGSADAMCSREEDKWKDDDDFALRSMAQTRASSKALASVLRFVVTLAGYSGTPAEEMSGDEGGPADPPATDKQIGVLGKAMNWLLPNAAAVAATWDAIKEQCGGEITGPVANALIVAIKARKDSEGQVVAAEQDKAAENPDPLSPDPDPAGDLEDDLPAADEAGLS